MSKHPHHMGPPPGPSFPKGLKAAPSTTSLNAANEARTQTAKEILATEESYTKSLECIVKLYVEPLQKLVAEKKPILSSNDIKVIFGQSEMLYRFHTEFLKELSPLIKNWNANQCIGPVFEKNAEVFKLYAPYVNSYPDGAFLLAEKQKKDKALNAFLRDQQMQTPGKNDLPSLLIMPIQRVPRYRMLLETLVKNTQPIHPDYASLSNALEKIKSVADAINEKKKKAEMIQKVTAIQDSFDDDLTLVESFRVFVTEGTVTYYAKREATGETLTYYLFNDKILFAAKGKKMKLRESLDLVKTEIKDVMDSSSADGFAIKNAFEIITVTTTLLLAMPTVKEKEDFIKEYYFARSKAAALITGPHLPVEAERTRASSVSGGRSPGVTPSGSGSGSKLARDEQEEKDRERERKEKKERREREEKERKDREERERLERREREEREKREHAEAELAKMKRELEQAREAERARERERERPQAPAQPKQHRVPPEKAPAPPAHPGGSGYDRARPKPGVLVEDACAQCGEELEGKLMKVGTNRWHKRCFKCVRCKGPVEESFNTEHGWPICDACFASNATRCPGCHSPILDKYIKALGKEWHKECFLCYKCKRPFTSGDCEVEDGKPVHSGC